MNNTKNTFWEVINNKNIERILIPNYQRDYAQGRDENIEIAKTFISDIVTSLNKKANLSLGLIYGCQKNNNLEIVDGQQRFTMLWLFHVYVTSMAEKDLSLLHKFSYNTRCVAQNFCSFLCNLKIKRLNTLNIQDNIQFQSKWHKDPTVCNMLTVIDLIDEAITSQYNCNIFYDNLLATDCPIKFDYLSIDNITSDHIYMAMNSRGLELTDFEHFKSKMFDNLKNNELEKKIDVEYTDYFWKILYQDKKEEGDSLNADYLDQSLLNFITEFARVKAYKENITFLKEMTKNQNNWLAWFKDKDFSSDFEQKLDSFIKYASSQVSVKLLSSLKTRTYNERLNLYAHLIFYNKIDENSRWESIYNTWSRIIDNIIKNTNNNESNYANMLILMDEIVDLINFKDSNFDMYAAIANSKDKRDVAQWLQEKQKAKLIFNKTIEETDIIRAENINGFDGNIRFLLSFEGTSVENFEKEKFIKYTDIAICILDNKNVNESNFSTDYLLIRSILTYEPQLEKGVYLRDTHSDLYDYLKGMSEVSSIIELREATIKLFASLLDLPEINHNSVKTSLEKKTNNYKLQEDRNNIAYWRLVHHTNLLIKCTRNNYIYTFYGKLRLFAGKNQNNLYDFDLTSEFSRDAIKVLDLFGKRQNIEPILENELDIFYRSWQPTYFNLTNNIAISVLTKDSHVSIGIAKDDSIDRNISTLESRWPASSDEWWASVLTFPIGSFEQYEQEIKEYKLALEAIL